MTKLIVLYPGAMKPFHDGHLSLLESYISNNDNIIPDTVHIIISPSDRSGITALTTEHFIRAIDFSKINNLCKIQIQISTCSPIVACYAICGHSEDPDEKFVLATSLKGDDLNRAAYFKSLFSKGGKYYSELYPERVIDINVNQKPLYYTTRTDEYNGIPISSTIVRNDIINRDYENFKAAYTNMLNRGLIHESILKDYYNALCKEVIVTKEDAKKLNYLLHESFIDKLIIKTNKIYPMNRRLNEGIETIKLNITDMAADCQNVDFNALRDTLTDMGATVMGQIGNGDLYEAEGDDNVYMIIDGLSEKEVKDTMIDIISQYEDDVIDIAPESYFVDTDTENDLDDDIPQNDEDIDDAEDDVEDTDDADFPAYDDVDVDDADEDEPDYPAYDDVDVDEDEDLDECGDLTECGDMSEEFESWDAENSCFTTKKLHEKKGDCCPKKKRMINLSEALKAADPKDLKKLDNSVKSIEDIIKSVKGQTIGASEVADAFKKLKAEQNKLKKIGKNEDGETFSLTDVPGVASTFKKLADSDPEKAEEIKKYQKALKESVETALMENRSYLHKNITINGKNMKDYSVKELKKLMFEANETKVKLTDKFKKSLNESVETKTILKDKIANKIRLINLLDEELTYRITRAKCLRKLNEEEETEEKKDDTKDFSDEELNKMFGSGLTEEIESEDTEETSEEDEVVDLARVVITMQDKDAAEDLKKTCIDAGIPEEAIEIEEGDEVTEVESEESEDAEEEKSEEEETEETEEKEQPNESVKYKNLHRLFEEEETEDADDDSEKEDDAEEDSEEKEDTEDEEKEDEEGAVKFILTDTDYVKDLAKILDDVYGISKEEFEEMIGGEIVDDEESEESEESDKDTEKEDKEDSEEDEKPEDDIDPAELFKGL